MLIKKLNEQSTNTKIPLKLNKTGPIYQAKPQRKKTGENTGSR